MRKEVNKIRIRQKVKTLYKKPELNLLYEPKLFKRQYRNLIDTNQWFYYYALNQSSEFKKKKSQKYIQVQNQGNYFVSLPVSPKNVYLEELLQTEKQKRLKSFDKKKKKHYRKIVTHSFSPYIRDGKQYQKLIHKLKPVTGPTESIMKQIQQHNNNNWKNTQSVLLASKDSFKDKIVRFLSRFGLKSSEKVFVMNSKDKHIKEALLRNGWVEAVDSSSLFFHLKWVYTDTLNDYTNLQEGQFFNHFKNNQQLTNKNLLRRNINKADYHLQPNYPMTFDFQCKEDISKFQTQFYRFQCFNILSELQNIIVANFQNYYLKLLKLNSLGLAKGKIFIFGIGKTRQKQLIKKYQPKYFENKQLYEQKKIRSALYQFYFEVLRIVESTRHSKKRKGITNLKKQAIQINNIIEKCFEEDSKEKDILLNTLHYDKFLLLNLLLLYQEAKECFESNFGTNNWWIIKPTGVSRGTGIRIQKDFLKIINNKYGKIAQKYIEKPLLLNCNRKFDIRQWVLVKSFLPLEAYLFQRSYCRFSTAKYDPENHQNLIVHLTNYSQQKQFFQKSGTSEQSIMSEEELERQIDGISGNGRWELIKKQISQQILKTLKCCQNQIVDRSQCFEVYGFDILLDSQYKPWLLQVNMSPACQRRSQFLSQYLNKMAEGIIDMLEQRQIRYWQKIDESNGQEYDKFMRQNKMIKNYWQAQEEAACKIQRVYRKFREKKKMEVKVEVSVEVEVEVQDEVAEPIIKENQIQQATVAIQEHDLT